MKKAEFQQKREAYHQLAANMRVGVPLLVLSLLPLSYIVQSF